MDRMSYETAKAYEAIFEGQNGHLRQKNAFFWDLFK
jgi:hypothetical protein